jgi:hypothetical protein
MEFNTANMLVHNLSFEHTQGRVDLDASYQRPNVWNLEKKQYFVDSILRSIPTPKISVRHIEHATSGELVLEVADGKQRITCILEFLQNKFKLHQDLENITASDGKEYPLAGLSYKQLHIKVRQIFDHAQLSCDYIKATDEEIRDYFRRINNQKPVTSFEKRNSLLGNVNTLVAKLILNPMAKLVSAKKPMKQKEYCERMILIENNGIDNLGHKTFVEMHKKLKSLPLDKHEKQINETLDLLFKVFGKLSVKAFKFSAESAALFQIFKEYGDIFVDIKEVSDWYVKTITERQDNKIYQRLSRQTSAKANVQYLYNTLKASIESYIDSGKIILKDGKRNFTSNQREKILGRAKAVCQNCQKDLLEEPFHADHIVPHSKGGKTTLENGQLLCPKCNLAKSNK